MVFQSDNGLVYVFGANGGNIFDMNIGDGLAVNIGTAQGFQQIGESVEAQTVGGKPINVSGTVYNNIQSQKATMRHVFAPFTTGKLIFDDKYYIRVYVKESPTFSAVKNDGRFVMQLYAPYPFFTEINERINIIGEIEPMFMFPVNYANPHTFGVKGVNKYINVKNDGDVKVPFGLHLETNGVSNNPVITNLLTLESIKINGELGSGEKLDIYRTSDNVLMAELTSAYGETQDVISWIDEGSTLFELKVGDNLLSADDDEDGVNLVARISYSPALVAVYES